MFSCLWIYEFSIANAFVLMFDGLEDKLLLNFCVNLAVLKVGKERKNILALKPTKQLTKVEVTVLHLMV